MQSHVRDCRIDEMSLTVSPRGYLEVGTQLVVTCSVRYGAPITEPNQDPALTLSLDDNRLSGQLYYHAPSGTDQLHRKTLVTAGWSKNMATL